MSYTVMKRTILSIALIAAGIGTAGAKELVLFATGMTRGNLERCGCIGKQTGGFEPRAGFVEHRRNLGVDVLLFDIGSFTSMGQDPVDDSLSYATLDAMAFMGYTAASIGRTELMLPKEKLLPLIESAKFPVLAANLKLAGSDEKAPWKPSVIIEHEGKKIGVVGIAPYIPRSPVLTDGFEIEPLKDWPPRKLLDAVGEPVDLIVLLTQEGLTAIQTWLQEAQDIETPIVAFNKQFSKLHTPVGRHTAIGVYSMGKKITETALDFSAENPTTATAMHSIEPGAFHNEAMRDLLDRYYIAVTQTEETKAKIPPVLMTLAEEMREGDGYTGGQECVPCHKTEYHQWYNTRHRRAFLTLLNRQRYMLPDCVNCHTTGYGHPEGYTRFTQTENLAGVQCETCHGPGKLHAAEPETVKMRREMDQKFCVQCHDEANSPGFTERFDRAWRQIVHKPVPAAKQEGAQANVRSVTAPKQVRPIPVIPVIPASKLNAEKPAALPGG